MGALRIGHTLHCACMRSLAAAAEYSYNYADRFAFRILLNAAESCHFTSLLWT